MIGFSWLLTLSFFIQTLYLVLVFQDTAFLTTFKVGEMCSIRSKPSKMRGFPITKLSTKVYTKSYKIHKIAESREKSGIYDIL